MVNLINESINYKESNLLYNFIIKNNIKDLEVFFNTNIIEKNYHIIKFFLENGYNKFKNDKELSLFLAIKNNDTEIIKLLYHYGSNIHIDNNSPLNYAVSLRNYTIATYLFNN